MQAQRAEVENFKKQFEMDMQKPRDADPAYDRDPVYSNLEISINDLVTRTALVQELNKIIGGI
eukprot:9656645-Karenia_brevis.AAC.1